MCDNGKPIKGWIQNKEFYEDDVHVCLTCSLVSDRLAIIKYANMGLLNACLFNAEWFYVACG